MIQQKIYDEKKNSKHCECLRNYYELGAYLDNSSLSDEYTLNEYQALNHNNTVLQIIHFVGYWDSIHILG